MLLLQAGEIVDSKKEYCGYKACHDREARKMTGQRMARQNKIPMATARCARRRPDLTQYVEKISASRKVERDLCGDGRSGNHCETKDRYVEQQLPGKRQKRNIVRSGAKGSLSASNYLRAFRAISRRCLLLTGSRIPFREHTEKCYRTEPTWAFFWRVAPGFVRNTKRRIVHASCARRSPLNRLSNQCATSYTVSVGKHCNIFTTGSRLARWPCFSASYLVPAEPEPL